MYKCTYSLFIYKLVYMSIIYTYIHIYSTQDFDFHTSTGGEILVLKKLKEGK